VVPHLVLQRLHAGPVALDERRCGGVDVLYGTAPVGTRTRLVELDGERRQPRRALEATSRVVRVEELPEHDDKERCANGGTPTGA
jgi:hypothetical protein